MFRIMLFFTIHTVISLNENFLAKIINISFKNKYCFYFIHSAYNSNVLIENEIKVPMIVVSPEKLVQNKNRLLCDGFLVESKYFNAFENVLNYSDSNNFFFQARSRFLIVSTQFDFVSIPSIVKHINLYGFDFIFVENHLQEHGNDHFLDKFLIQISTVKYFNRNETIAYWKKYGNVEIKKRKFKKVKWTPKFRKGD